MTDRALEELAARVEALTGPDRDMDVEIARYRGVTVLLRNDEGTANYETTHWHYTASIDAAMSLVPEGLFARIYCEASQAVIVRSFSGGWLEVSRSGLCHDPALALTAAALRAIAGKER